MNSTIHFEKDWKDKLSDNAGLAAISSGTIGGLSSYVRGGVQNSKNWADKRQILAAIAGGAVAGVGGYGISKSLKRDKPGQAEVARKVGQGHQNTFSARHALDSIIQMSTEEPTERTKRASKENWAAKVKPGQKSISREAGSKAGKKMLDETAKFIKKLSARDQLNLITLGVDANGKLHNSKGEFGGDNDAVAHPQAMRMTYAKAAGLGAAAGVAGGLSWAATTALIKKLSTPGGPGKESLKSMVAAGGRRFGI